MRKSELPEKTCVACGRPMVSRRRPLRQQALYRVRRLHPAHEQHYCNNCRYDPKIKTGPRACPYTTLYWNFLDRHEPAFTRNPCTALMARNITRLTTAERGAIRTVAGNILATIV